MAADRDVGIGLIVGGGVSAIVSAILYWVSSSEHWNFGPLFFAIATSLLAVYLIGYGIKKVAGAA
jgi:hypothetical protein